ncbi:MAG: DUF1104 domain-containing protein [Sulfuricurvum sp.]|uniref:DUF1104 domain-containing protein n=1 Tax=Sulfuricurvum sp. TaxID=2025608 RepID=UPI0025F5BE44|nr:DUF1104 domain-containing protein [Sulfuricurvum sp.]MCK9373316.1 DUF1104 domain-containing protein [Sulfuricurvum sp.]
MKALTFVALLSVAAFSADYSTMTMSELQTMRGSVPEADRAAFQAEMQSRVQAMTVEERQAFKEQMKQSRSGAQDGSGSKNQTRSQSQTQTPAMQTQMQNQSRMGGGRSH